MNLKDFNNILVIISTKSLKYKEYKILIDNKLKKYDVDYNIILTENKDSITKISKDFSLKNKNSLLIVVGGDGSINEAVSSIINSDITFAFLPGGTGNDFSRTIYNGLSTEDIINFINDIEIKYTDIIRINSDYCINVVSFGYDSLVLKKSLELKPKLGKFSKLSFILGIIFTLNKIRPSKFYYKFNLSNGQYLEGKDSYLITALCNGKYYGGGFMPAPKASIDDGYIKLNLCENTNFLKLIHLLFNYKSDKHLNLSISHNYEITSGIIESLDSSNDGNLIINLDGNLKYYKKINFEILPKKLKLAIFKNRTY